MTGVVTCFYKKSHTKKPPYGFIDGDDGKSYYFQFAKGQIGIGEKVSFEGNQNEKGNIAENVVAICQ